MRVVLHLCCAPCAIVPLERLRLLGHQVLGFFHNPNIHPFLEFQRRIEALDQYALAVDFEVHVDRRYGLTDFLRQVVFHEQERCDRCYEMRLRQTVEQAKTQGADAFTTTLLYSRYQKHDRIVSLCRSLADRHHLHFLYEDYRHGWQQGIEESIRRGLYRQPYCGCIFSEQERYDPSLRRPGSRKPSGSL